MISTDLPIYRVFYLCCYLGSAPSGVRGSPAVAPTGHRSKICGLSFSLSARLGSDLGVGLGQHTSRRKASLGCRNRGGASPPAPQSLREYHAEK